jgi:hypothetical protein
MLSLRPMRSAVPSFFRSAALAMLLAWGGAATAQEPPAAGVQVVGDAVVFNGQINARSAAEFLRLLRDDPKITRLVIGSRGGSVTAALDMALALHERLLDVEVPVACMSSCANYVFPAGRRKILGWPGAVAWHGNITHVLYRHQTGQGTWSNAQIEGARRLAQREAQFFRGIGVDGFVCWFGKIAPYDTEDFYWLSVPDMERFGIRDVTVRDASRVSAKSDLRQVVVDWATLDATRPAVSLDP